MRILALDYEMLLVCKKFRYLYQCRIGYIHNRMGHVTFTQQSEEDEESKGRGGFRVHCKGDAIDVLVDAFAFAATSILGLHYPRVSRGNMVLINAYAMHRDPGVWDEPMRFMPERFENVKEKSHGNKFIPFGAWRRMCSGASMANKVMASSALVGVGSEKRRWK
ncbi:hypothetical protein QQ045_022758 [Rhodiola kirilowii]